MKKTLFTLLISSIICLPFFVKAQQVIITDDAAYTTPASGSMLDVKSTNKGFMPPRVALTSLTDASTIASPTTGLMVYNTGAAALNDKGIYFWNGTIWVKALSGGIDGTNYMAIADDGTVSLKGNATVWNDIVVPPFSTYFGVDNYPLFAVFQNGIKTFTFEDKGAANTEQQVYFSIQMPHNWKEGTTIYPHVHWSPQTVKSGNVVWGFEYTWAEYDATTPVVFPTSTIVTATTGVSTNGADTHYITSFAPITPTTSQDKISGILMCRFFRNSSNSADTYSGNAALLSFDIHYEIDAFGSGTEFIK